MECEHCNGPLMLLGVLGDTKHFRCRNCGAEVSEPEPRDDFDHEERDVDLDRPEYERELPEDYEPSPYDGTYSED